MANARVVYYRVSPDLTAPAAISRAAGRQNVYDYNELPKTSLKIICNVFADGLADVEDGINTALLTRQLTTEYMEEGVRPDLVYVISALRSIHKTQKKFKASETPGVIMQAIDTLVQALFHLDASEELQKKLEKNITGADSVDRKNQLYACQKLVEKAHGLLTLCALRE